MTEPALDGATCLLSAKDLVRSFGAQCAVDHLSLELHRGEILGFLGPNGAGKSTALRMITGSLQPDSGTVQICGHRVHGAAGFEEELLARQSFGYLPESLPLYPEMLVKEYLEFIADSRELRGALRKTRLRAVVEQLELGSVLRRPCAALSKGFRQRVGLAQALLHDPKVLILDEPTNGLDPKQITEFRSLLVELAKDKAIIFSTHILQEIAAICTRLLVIRNGRQIAIGSPAELRATIKERLYCLTIKGQWPSKTVELQGLGKFHSLSQQNGTGTLRYAAGEQAPDLGILAAQVLKQGCQLNGAILVEPSLEQVYLQLMDGESS